MNLKYCLKDDHLRDKIRELSEVCVFLERQRGNPDLRAWTLWED